MEILKGKGAVVTGAASGIGKAIATAFVEAGASVLLCDVNATRLDAAARELGERAIGRVTDVSDEHQVEAAMRAAREAFGSLDIVVNCAGFGAIMALTELPAEQWRSVHTVTQRCFLRRKAWGPTDAGAGTPRRHHQHFVSERAAPDGGELGLLCGKGPRRHAHTCGALELGPRSIRVVRIAPGLVETPLTRHELENPEIREIFMAVIPMKRAVEAEEIAAAAVFLASEHGRSINGETIAVDGGLLTRGTPALLTGLHKAS
jgi:NAD(P)-dependent dehydrogenase (short-subunit alcohol dehydrogenase family)